MSIRLKTLLLLSLVLGIVLLLTLVSSLLILQRVFHALEAEYTRRDVGHARRALENELSVLDTILHDYASRDAISRYASHPTPREAPTMLSPAALRNLQLDLAAMYDRRGRLVDTTTVDRAHTQGTVPRELQSLLQAQIQARSPAMSPVRGILLYRHRPMMVAMRPILASRDAGSPAGLLVMGAYLDDQTLEKITGSSGLRVALYDRSGAGLTPEDRQAVQALLGHGTAATRVAGKTVYGYSSLPTLDGQQSVLIRVANPRAFSQQGAKSLRVCLAALAGLGGTLILCALLLDWIVLQHMRRLCRGVRSIGASGDLTARLRQSGRDELDGLAADVNGMLEALEHAQAISQERNALRAIDQAKNEFLAVLTHELLTPLTNILGWSAMAKRIGTREVMEQALDVVQRNGRRQRRLVHDLLDASRVVHGVLQLEHNPIDLCRLATQAAEEFCQRIQGRRLHFAVAVPESPLIIGGDEQRLGQVLDNLLSNAGKFTPEGGRVTLRLRREGDRAVLTVQDTGRGLAPEHLPLLFTPFTQVQRDETRGGLGLGLTLVKGLVELHGGTVAADSPGLDQGSTFTVTLPLAPADASAGEDPTEASA